MPRLRSRTKTQASRLEAKFTLYWRGLNGPELQREFVFHPGRRWRADFAHIESRTLIEIEGGIFLASGGRHNRAAGFIADAEKYLEAFLAGWSVVRLTQAQITAANVERLIQHLLSRQPHNPTSPYEHSPPQTAPRNQSHERQ